MQPPISELQAVG